MKRPTLVATGSLNRILEGAKAAWERKDFSESIETLESARRLAPSNTFIHLQLGRFHGLRYNYAAAENCFEQALRIAPKKIEMLATIADFSRDFRNPAVAEIFLRRAMERPDVTPQICVKLAELNERQRRLPEAAQLADRALAMQPAYPAALLVQARLERLAGRFEAGEKLLRSLLAQPIPDQWIQVQAGYELGQNLDRQNRFDDAMAAFLNAKSLLQPQASPYLDQLKSFRARLKVMDANITSDMLRRWFANGPALPPVRRVALLCGHARSGTTLLEQVLDTHPDIISADETTVFADDALTPLRRFSPPNADRLAVLEAADIPALQRARAGYFRFIELALGSPVASRLLLDKNPVLTYQIPAFIRILPETKFLIALRDPRDVVLSCFMQPQMLNPITAAYLSLEGTVADYTEQMRLWQTMAPLMPGHYLEVRYEHMVTDLESVARKTLNFLGVSWDARVLGFDEHARQKIVRSPTYADVTQPVYKRARGRWLNYQKYLEPHLEKLAPFVKNFGYQ
jgi:tetratricopeptide (TPR) repeat protein